MEVVIFLKNKSNRFLAFLFTAFVPVVSFAQDSGAVVNENVNLTTTTTTEWYADPFI